MTRLAMNGVNRPKTQNGAGQRLALIVSKFPCVDETFILREINALAQNGFRFDIYSIKYSNDRVVQPQAEKLQDLCIYDSFLFSKNVLSAQWHFLRRKPLRYFRTFFSFVRHMWAAPRSLMKALVLFPKAVSFCLRMQEKGTTHVHAFWATYPCAIAYKTKKLTGLPYSFSAHAHDIYEDGIMLPVKLRAAKFVMTCTEKNRVHLSGLAPDHAQKIKHVYHGLDLRKFREDASFHKNDDSMLRILSIGTLYRTKGFDVLIEACALLKKQAVPFQCKIVGDGPERDRLQRQISSLGLGEDVTLMGYLDQEALRSQRHWANAFALLPRPYLHWGLPNVYIESLASKLAVLATPLNAIDELVRNEKTGLVVESDDPEAAAAALIWMFQFPDERQRLAEAGQTLAYKLFDEAKTTAEVVALFRQVVAPQAVPQEEQAAT